MTASRSWKVHLLGGWEIFQDRRPVRVTYRQQRLIAMLALYGSQPRSFLAGMLWPNSSEKQATGSLRESIWLVSHQLPGLLVEGRDPLGLAPSVMVDVHIVRRQAEALEMNRGSQNELERVEMLETLRNAELLSGWYEDWITEEQERWQQLRVKALERLAAQFLGHGETGLAVEAAACAIATDPLRESAERLLLEAYLSEGNIAQALRSYEAFRGRLREEFGVEPSARLAELMAPLQRARKSAFRPAGDRSRS